MRPSYTPKESILFLIILAMSLNANAVKYLMVYNREHQPIFDADVSINGTHLKFKSGFGYVVDSLPAPPFHVIAKHKDYLPTEYKNLQRLSDLFLMRKGEDYYYQAPGVKIPILHRRDAVYVVMVPKDESGKPIHTDTAQNQLGKFLSEHNLKIICSYKDSVQNMKSPEGKGYDRHLHYSYMVGYVDGREFKGESPELKTLRNNPAVQTAGPALFQSENYKAAPMAYGCRIQVLFAQNVSEEEAKKRLALAGYTETSMSYVSQLRLYSIKLSPETGMSMNQHVELLKKIEGIIEIEPELIAYIDY